MLELLGKYYGLDLIATGFTLYSLYLLGDKKSKGFFFGIVGNVLWIILSIYTASVGLLLTNFFIIVFNIRGYRKWNRQSEYNKWSYDRSNCSE